MNKNKEIILIGAGGHAISCIDVIEKEHKYKIIGLIGSKDEVGKTILGYKVIGTDNDLEKLFKSCKSAIVTIGHLKNYIIRLQVFKNLQNIGFEIPSVISPKSYISKHAKIGKGSILMHGAIVNADARIGSNCIINSNSLIEHGASIGNNCHVSTGAIINGDVIIEDNCFIGSNSVIKHGVKIHRESFIKMSSEITRDFSVGQEIHNKDNDK